MDSSQDDDSPDPTPSTETGHPAPGGSGAHSDSGLNRADVEAVERGTPVEGQQSPFRVRLRRYYLATRELFEALPSDLDGPTFDMLLPPEMLECDVETFVREAEAALEAFEGPTDNRAPNAGHRGTDRRATATSEPSPATAPGPSVQVSGPQCPAKPSRAGANRQKRAGRARVEPTAEAREPATTAGSKVGPRRAFTNESTRREPERAELEDASADAVQQAAEPLSPSELAKKLEWAVRTMQEAQRGANAHHLASLLSSTVPRALDRARPGLGAVALALRRFDLGATDEQVFQTWRAVCATVLNGRPEHVSALLASIVKAKEQAFPSPVLGASWRER
jgi:hypothetical protein